MWEVIRDEIIENLIYVLPILLAAFILIALLETYFARRTYVNKLSVLAGATFGLVPQCGFSVVATDMYTKKKITIGVLLAIYIATSDEAIPVILSHPDKILSLLPLLLIKFIFAIAVGYTANAILNKRKNKELASTGEYIKISATVKNEKVKLVKARGVYKTESKENPEQNFAPEEGEHHIGCCGHHIACRHSENVWKKYLLHPFIHAIKIFAYILVVSIAFALMVYFIGEENLSGFLSGSYYFGPLFACLIGLIPNCAASVIITELYVIGGLSFGACLAGLCINAGLGFMLLFKQNKNQKENFAILGTLFGLSLVLGYAVLLIQPLLGL